MVQPFYQETLALNSTHTHFTHTLDETLSLRNLIIEVTSKEHGLKKFTTYYSATMRVLIFENVGELKVTRDGQDPLSLVYVKVYSIGKNSQTAFFKDGYTDLRGRFDYGQLSGKDIS